MPEFQHRVPVRLREWVSFADGLVHILVPRYGDSALGLWIGRKVRKPHIEIRLDDVGSLIWLSCDGRRSAGDIAGLLSDEFGERVEPADERLSIFLRQLLRNRCIRWRSPSDSPSSR